MMGASRNNKEDSCRAMARVKLLSRILYKTYVHDSIFVKKRCRTVKGDCRRPRWRLGSARTLAIFTIVQWKCWCGPRTIPPSPDQLMVSDRRISGHWGTPRTKALSWRQELHGVRQMNSRSAGGWRLFDGGRGYTHGESTSGGDRPLRVALESRRWTHLLKASVFSRRAKGRCVGKKNNARWTADLPHRSQFLAPNCGEQHLEGRPLPGKKWNEGRPHEIVALCRPGQTSWITHPGFVALWVHTRVRLGNAGPRPIRHAANERRRHFEARHRRS